MWKNKKQQDYNDLLNEVVGDQTKEKPSDYQLYLEERKSIIPLSLEEREKVEQIIRVKLLEIFLQAKKDAQGSDENKGFFKYKPIFEIPEIKDYFNIFGTLGDRNIGKSTSSKEEIREVVKNKRRFMFIRNIDDEIEAQLQSDMDERNGYLPGNGWSYEGKAKMPNIVDLEGNVVGFYRALNTSAKFKSVDFPDVDLMVYEEFNEVKIGDKYEKFVKFVSTVVRFNPNAKVITQANYVDQGDELLQAFGIGMEPLTSEDFVRFNWEIGAIIIFIPKGIYRQPKNKQKDLGLRASLGSYKTWKSQFGGGFGNETPINIINDNFSAIEPVFNIYYQNVTGNNQAAKKYGAFKMTLYRAYDEDGKPHNVLMETVEANDKPIFIYDYLNKIMYPQAHLMTPDSLDNLIEQWNNGNLKTVDMHTHGRIVTLLAIAKKALQSNEEYITDVENIFI